MVAATISGQTALLLELGLVLLGLGLLARVSDWLEFSPIPLYLIAGLALGQATNSPLSFSTDVVEAGAELGVVLLLFMLGLEYTGEDLASGLRSNVRLAALDGLLNFLPGFLIALLIGWEIQAAVLLGGVTYISSSGIVSKLLSDLGRIGNRETPAILNLLVVEDLVMALYLPLVAVLLAGAGLVAGISLLTVALSAAIAGIFIAIKLSSFVSKLISTRSDEVFMLTTLGLVLLLAGAAQGAQLSAAVGAFFAGILLSGSVAGRARKLLTPLRDLFAAVFFTFFAFSVDLAGIPPVFLAAVGLALLTSGTKLLTGWFAAKQLGVGFKGRIRAGTALIARGEFSIVIAGLGVSAGIEPELGPLAASYVLMTAFIASIITRWANTLGDKFEQQHKKRTKLG